MPPPAQTPTATSSQKRKVALVAPSLRILGGVAVQADTLLRAWRDDPDIVAWLVPIDPLPPRPFRWLTSIKYVRTIVTELLYFRQLLRQLAKADVVHVFSAANSSFLLAALPAILIGRMLGKPVVLNYHSGEAPLHLRRSRVARAVIARADLIVVQSRYLQEVFATFGLDAIIVPNTIEFARFPFKARPRFTPRLLSTRNLESRYNVACTIRAFRIVKDHYPEATLTVAGYGREEAALRLLVDRLGLTDVTFVGRIPVDEMGRYYDAADLFVQTPNIDNMPLSVLQAFAAGLPVVSTDAGGVPTLLRRELDGLLAPSNDHCAVAAQILRLLAGQSMAARLAQSAYDSCQQYAWSAVRGQWLDVYGHARIAKDKPAATRPRVVVFMSGFEPGGTERQFTELISRLDRTRLEVHVACFHRRGAWLSRVEATAASVKEFPISGFARLSTLRQLMAFVRWCRALDPVAIQCTGLYSNVFGLLGGAIAGVPLRIGSRREINPGRSAALTLAQRVAYAHAHTIVANCRAAAIRLRREGVRADHITVIHNGIDDSRAVARLPRPEITRAIVVANLRPEKAHRVLIDAAPPLLRKHPRLTFTIVGDGPLRQTLQEQCERYGIADRVTFLGYREDIPQLLAASDLFVLPSRSEAAPNAIIEAMAAGLPVVACAVGGNREIVQDGRTGRLVPADDGAALATAIDALISNPEMANAMGVCGRDLIRSTYSYEIMIAAFDALYTSRTGPLETSQQPQPGIAA